MLYTCVRLKRNSERESLDNKTVMRFQAIIRVLNWSRMMEVKPAGDDRSCVCMTEHRELGFSFLDSLELSGLCFSLL